MKVWKVKKSQARRGAFADAVLIPAQGNDHASVVMANTDLPLAQVNPKRPGTSAEPEGTYHGGLRRVHEVRGREERVDPVGGLLVLTDHLHFLVEEKRAPFLANAHGRVNRPTVNSVHAPHAVLVPIVVKLAPG